MISTILGIKRVVNSIRAGIDMRPMIGPSTRPRNRSMIVQAAPPATCRNSSGHRVLTSIATTSPTIAIATNTRPLRGTIWKSSGAGGPETSAGGAPTGAGAVISAIGGNRIESPGRECDRSHGAIPMARTV